MSQPIQLSPSTSPKSPLNPQPHLHNCRWDWCRLTFPTSALLIDHVIHQHVRSAQPVRRRDLPMLRRAEEGVGESLRFSMSDSLQTPLASGSSVRTSSQTFPHPPRPSKRARTKQHSQPEPSSPTQTHSPSQAETIIKPAPSTPSVPHSHPTNTDTNTNPSPHSLDPKPSADPTSPYSPKRRTFAQLSEGSPDSYIAPDSPPPSPSFDSQVANAIRALTSKVGFGFGGGRGRSGRDASPTEPRNHLPESPSPRSRKGKERAVSVRRVSPEHEQDFSQISNSQTSQERVECELTQETGSDIGMDRDVEGAVAEPGASKTSGTGKLTTPTSTSNSRFNGAQRMDSQSLGPEGQGHGDMDVDAELEWPEDMPIPGSGVPIVSPPQPQDDSQPLGNSDLSAPFVLKRQAPLYTAPSPSSLSRTADQQQHTSRATASPDQILSQTKTQSQNQNQNRLRARRSFRSGSLKVIPGLKISRRGSTSQSIGNDRSASGNVSGSWGRVGSAASMEADALISQAIAKSQSQQLESQESQGSVDAGAYKHSYIQLQTQAPYQSQSQSLSETNAG